MTSSNERLATPHGLEDAVRFVARSEGADIVDLSIVLGDHETVRGLNESHLGRSYDTDVLAFDLRGVDGEETAGMVEGEIYVDLDTASERAPEFGADYEQEVRRYVIHGLLHLLGYEDAHPDGRATMSRLEDHYLSRLNDLESETDHEG